MSVALNLFSNLALGRDLLSARVPASELAAWASQHHDPIMLGGYLYEFGQVLALAFVVLLARRAEPGGGLLSVFAIAGTALLVSVSLIGAATNFAMLELARSGADPGSLSDLLSLAGGLRAIDSLPAAVGYGMLGVLIVRSGVLPRLLGWWIAAMAILTLMVLPVSIFVPALGVVGFISFLLFLLWLVSASMLLQYADVGIKCTS